MHAAFKVFSFCQGLLRKEGIEPPTDLWDAIDLCMKERLFSKEQADLFQAIRKTRNVAWHNWDDANVSAAVAGALPAWAGRR